MRLKRDKEKEVHASAREILRAEPGIMGTVLNDRLKAEHGHGVTYETLRRFRKELRPKKVEGKPAARRLTDAQVAMITGAAEAALPASFAAQLARVRHMLTRLGLESVTVAATGPAKAVRVVRKELVLP